MRSSNIPPRSGRLTAVSAIAAAVAALSLTACGPHEASDASALVGGAPATSAAVPPAPVQQAPEVAEQTPAAQPAQGVTTAPIVASPSYQPPTYAPPTRTAQPQAVYAQPAPIEGPAPERRVVGDRNNIGSVESIEPIRERPQGSGAGAVIGGVLGAVVGNQFGHNAGRAAMTGLGAVGGAVAGNNIERNHREGVTGYRVGIRLDNGSARSYERADVANLQVGDRVHLDANSFHRV